MENIYILSCEQSFGPETLNIFVIHIQEHCLPSIKKKAKQKVNLNKTLLIQKFSAKVQVISQAMYSQQKKKKVFKSFSDRKSL